MRVSLALKSARDERRDFLRLKEHLILAPKEANHDRKHRKPGNLRGNNAILALRRSSVSMTPTLPPPPESVRSEHLCRATEALSQAFPGLHLHDAIYALQALLTEPAVQWHRDELVERLARTNGQVESVD